MSSNEPGIQAIPDAVLDQLEVLAAVEHALIVECLTVGYALGSGLDQTEGGPTTDEGRAVVEAAHARAIAEMSHFRTLNQALVSAGRTARTDRASSVTTGSGTAISLDPPSLAELQQLTTREPAIAAAVDAQYAKLDPAAVQSVFFTLPEHATDFAAMVAPLASVTPDVYLRATRRAATDSFEQRLLDASDSAYGLIVRALDEQFGSSGSSGLLPGYTMGTADEVNVLLVQRGLLPPFTSP
ncbi:MAG TPA: hypothetical protein VH089_04745 [Streptosporangiaceae bacterium]|nr:hypothetical protein [Streptosporangiaceae bacterium]